MTRCPSGTRTSLNVTRPPESLEGKPSAIRKSLIQLTDGLEIVKRSRSFAETSRVVFVIPRRRDRLESALLDLEHLDLRLQGRGGHAELGCCAERPRHPPHGFLQRRLDERALVVYERLAIG